LFGKACILYHVLAPATIVGASDDMQWAAVRTKVLLRRVPPQRFFPYKTKTCHGFEFFGLSMVPPTIRSEAKDQVQLIKKCL
jgi:hypothetical protein